jgi:hypothetical protein
MSTPSKKKVTKAPEAKAKYKNGGKVFLCIYCFGGPGMILEGQIQNVVTTEYPRSLNSANMQAPPDHQFKYLIATAKGEFEFAEYNVFPSYVEAAKYFGAQFTVNFK